MAALYPSISYVQPISPFSFDSFSSLSALHSYYPVPLYLCSPMNKAPLHRNSPLVATRND